MTRSPRPRPTWLRTGPKLPSLLSPFELTSLCEFGMFYRDDFLDSKTVLRIRAQTGKIENSEQLRPAGVGRGNRFRTNSEIRGDQIAWLEPGNCHSSFRPYFRRLESIRNELNRTAYLGLTRFDVQCSIHQAGSAGFKRHSDTFKEGRVQRRLTALYYLNPAWQLDQGGLLQLHLPTGSMDVEPRDNRFVVFLSDLEHEVTPVQGRRTALTAWFYREGTTIL